jgi:hypothetical protein
MLISSRFAFVNIVAWSRSLWISPMSPGSPPHDIAGVAVLRSPRPITPAVLRTLLRGLVDGLQHEKIDGRLWIVEPGRVRVHAGTAPDPDGA